MKILMTTCYNHEEFFAIFSNSNFLWLVEPSRTRCGRKSKRTNREIEDEKSKWGSRLKEDWKELGVNTVRGWCNKVKDRGWLASKLGTSKKKGRAKKKR